ncbi:MAG: HAD family hydrolase [Promethearchaeota archaeon]
MPTHPPILLFDVDGVLLDSRGHLIAALESMHDRYTNWNYELLARTSSLDIIRMFESGAKKRSIPSLNTMLTNFKDLIPNRFRRLIYIARMGKTIRKYDWKFSDFFPGTVETLRILESKGILMGAASNSKGERIARWFKLKEVDDLFPLYVSRDDRKIYGVKPSPVPLLALLLKIKKHYNLPRIDRNRVAFVGDLSTDVQAAQRAKVKSIAVLSGHSTQGELKYYNPDFIIPDITHIPKILPKLFPDDNFE